MNEDERSLRIEELDAVKKRARRWSVVKQVIQIVHLSLLAAAAITAGFDFRVDEGSNMLLAVVVLNVVAGGALKPLYAFSSGRLRTLKTMGLEIEDQLGYVKLGDDTSSISAEERAYRIEDIRHLVRLRDCWLGLKTATEVINLCCLLLAATTGVVQKARPTGAGNVLVFLFNVLSPAIANPLIETCSSRLKGAQMRVDAIEKHLGFASSDSFGRARMFSASE